MITYHTCQHALDGANPVVPSMPYPRKIPLANLAHICCPCYLGCQEHGVFMNGGLWDCALYTLWSLMVALPCFSLYELRPCALPQRKPSLGLMAALELGPLCCRGMWPARQALPPAAASASISCVPVNSPPFVSTSLYSSALPTAVLSSACLHGQPMIPWGQGPCLAFCHTRPLPLPSSVHGTWKI